MYLFWLLPWGMIENCKLSLLIKFYLDLFNCKVGKYGDIQIAVWMSFFHRRGRRPRRPVTFDLIKTFFSNRRAGGISRRDGWFDLSIFCLLKPRFIICSFLVRTRNEPKKPPMGVPLGTPSAVRILRCERGVMSDKPRHLCDNTRSQRLCICFGCCRGGWLKIANYLC